MQKMILFSRNYILHGANVNTALNLMMQVYMSTNGHLYKHKNYWSNSVLLQTEAQSVQKRSNRRKQRYCRTATAMTTAKIAE